MRHATIVGIFTVMLTLVSGLVFAEHVIDDSKNTGYLFVISGTSGSLDGDTLTLNGVPNVIYFSDRPHRIAGHLSLEKFVELWNQGSDNFKADPPNAQLSIIDNSGESHEVLMVKGDTIAFNVRLFQQRETTPNTFNAATLFVDDDDCCCIK